MSEQAAAPRMVRIGISACLLGEKVRYDGGHKRDAFLVDLFGRYVEWVPICPEVEVGMGVPRESVQLVQTGGDVRLVAPKSGTDYTDAMQRYVVRRARQLAKEKLCGYIFKKDSPSCGVDRVRVYDRGGVAQRTGRGMFAAAVMSHFPHLPVEEEGRLNDPRLRENFVTRVFACQRWQDMETGRVTRAALMRFHEQHKFVLMAHSPEGVGRLGRLLARAGHDTDNRKLAAAYFETFSTLMQRTPTRRGHTNVLHHLAGYVSEKLDRADREELTENIKQYWRGLLPLIVPITLLRHYVRKFEVSYLAHQVYLSPHPHELMLLNQL